MTLCYYATSHGYGHAIRVAQVIKALPPEMDVIIRTLVPETLFREELTRDFRYRPGELDCGCLQTDSVTVLPRETLDRYRQISERNHRELQSEIDFLRREGVTCVATDITSFGLYAAQQAGIPGLAISNFNWYDIYLDYVQTPEDQALLDQIAEEYAAATLALIVQPEMPTMADRFPNAQSVPIIARQGRPSRDRIDDLLGDRATPHYALLYFGLWGLELDWQALATLRDWTFLTYNTPPVAVSNVVTLDRSTWPMADVAASVDAVISKPGYGTVSECIANQVPLIYIPRTEFAEYASLVHALDRCHGGIPMTPEAFARGNWRASLDTAASRQMDPMVYQTDGAQVAAEIITRYAR